MYKVIFFDADGVLVKSANLFSEQLQADFGIKHEALQPFFTGPFINCGVGKADLREELAKVLTDWGWKGTVDELIEFWMTKGTEIDGELVEYIQSLREQGVRTYMTTHQEKYRGEYLRKTIGNGKVLDEIFFSAEIGIAKKNPEFFEEVYARLNEASRGATTVFVPREQILVVDDKLEIIEAAKSVGFDSYLYTNLGDFKKFLAA